MTDAIPFIQKVELEHSLDGHCLKEKRLTVQGISLKECKDIFDEEWVK